MFEMFHNWMISIGRAVVEFFSGIGQGITASKAMEAIARQPEAAGNIRSTMIIAMALMEALTIYGLLIAFMLIGKI